MQKAVFRYSADQIRKALNKERLGGICFFSICGAGETFVPDETIEIINQLLAEGHYVNVTTNGTLYNRIEKLLDLCNDSELERLQFAFSLHYLELKNRNMLDQFVGAVHLVQKRGCSFLIQLNLYDGYIPFLDEIKEFSIRNFGALPQVALTRKEDTGSVKNGDVKIHSALDFEEYTKLGYTFNSSLFKFTAKNFMVKRKEFCYAGDWSGCINLATGIFSPCYASKKYSNIFENPDKPIRWCAVGNNCKLDYCVNSSHFMSMGVIPDITCPTYVDLRNRKNANWYNPVMCEVLTHKLSEMNTIYTPIDRVIVNIRNRIPSKLYLRNKMISLLSPEQIQSIKKIIRK